MRLETNRAALTDSSTQYVVRTAECERAHVTRVVRVGSRAEFDTQPASVPFRRASAQTIITNSTKPTDDMLRDPHPHPHGEFLTGFNAGLLKCAGL